MVCVDGQNLTIGSLGRPGHLHIWCPPGLPDTHTHNEAHDLAARWTNATETLALLWRPLRPRAP